ncbi:radical SAM/SPASM domain-containing protein [Fibrobacterota bacterium]
MSPDRSLLDQIGSLYREKNVPYSVLFEITGKCNLNCFHCYNARRAEPVLSLDEVEHTLKQLANLGCLYLTLSGGEVFCRHDHQAVFQKVRELGFAWNLFTNATLITEERARELKLLNVMEVSVSVFSAESEIHDGITGVPGSLAKTVRGLELLKEQGIRLNIKCVLMKRNVKDYRGIVNLANRVTASCQFDTNVMPGADNDFSPLKERLDRDDLEQVLSDNDVFPRAGKPVLEKRTHCDIDDPAGNDRQLVCSAGITCMSIDPYGGVYSCIHHSQPAGSLREQDIRTIWEASPVFKQLREISPDRMEACRTCAHTSYCSRCPALAEREDGNLLGCSTWARSQAEIMRGILKGKAE